MKPIKAIKTRLKKFKRSRLEFKLLSSTLLRRRKLRLYVKSLKPKNKILKRKVLKFFDDLLEYDLAPAINVLNLVREIDDKVKHLRYAFDINEDDFRLVLFALKLIGTTFELSSDIFRNRVYSDCKEKLEVYMDLMKNDQWFELTPSEKSKFAKMINYIWKFSPERSKEFIDFILKISKNKNWKNLPEELRGQLILTCSNFFITGQNHEVYINSIFKMQEIGIEFGLGANIEPYMLLRKLVFHYKGLVESKEIGIVTDFQDLIADLALLDPEKFNKHSFSIFKELTKDQFLTLCSKLAKENPDLVDLAGEELEILWEKAS